MCDQCRSATARVANNRTMGAPLQERAVVFGTSFTENPGSAGPCCGKWRKSCCGGGCCGSAVSNEPCRARDQASDGRQAAGIARQFQQTSNSRSLCSSQNRANSSGCGSPSPQTSCCRGCNYATNGLASSSEAGDPIVEMGVCPAMMNNLPCTPLSELKCFGGDCREDDTDSEDSREI